MTTKKKVTFGTIAAVLTLAFAFLALTDGVYGQQAEQETFSTLDSVLAYAPAVTPYGSGFVVDQGLLYTGQPGAWQRVQTPDGLIVNTVAVDQQRPQTVVIGAGDRSLLYISRDGGEFWQAIPLESETPSGITALAIDSAHRLIYAGTFTNGVYRLRDVGSSVIAAGHLLLDEPVAQVVADNSGTGIALVRTEWNLYRAEEMGLTWLSVENLPSPATSVAIAGTPAAIYVGTASSGIVRSTDGLAWQPANQGLSYTPGSQLYVSALATDPLQPNVLYAATNLIFGSANAHMTPVNLVITTNGADSWQPSGTQLDAVLTELMPISGQTGVVYGLSQQSRTPLALGDAPAPVVVQPMLEPAAPAASVEAVANGPLELLKVIAWIVAGLSTTALTLLLAYEVYGDVRRRREEESRPRPAALYSATRYSASRRLGEANYYRS